MPITKLVLLQSQSQRQKRSKERMVFVRYSHQSKTTTMFTKINIPKDQWDKKNQRAKRSFPGHTTANILLSKEYQKVEDIKNMALINGINPTIAYVKDNYLGRLKDKEQLKPISFWEFIEKFMVSAEKRLSANTIRSYKTSIKNLKNYEKHAKIRLDWHNIDMDFYHDYYDYYINYLDLKMNGFGKIIKLLKTILNDATEQGYNDNKIYKSKNFKVVKENVDNIYLNEEELDNLISLDLSHDQKLEKVRDLFYVGCYTGLRFSDLGEVNYSNIKGNMLHIKTQKTGASVIIPILKELKVIIDKYKANLPKPYTNQVMNRYLKELGQLAGLDDSFNTYNNKGTGRVKSTFKRWELVSTHTARRSFATNMYKRGIPTLSIMTITGHSSEKVFMGYIKISGEENAQRFLEKND